ncbi:hypothetical protein [Actinomyces gerencseriae]|uniref:hypothetical protein n=1 Tax=Actinomyces gerencseriae TaxID=52769 RepID=UPI0012ECAE44|nr:hypothetical protein [Actinomyces gerencseriae]
MFASRATAGAGCPGTREVRPGERRAHRLNNRPARVGAARHVQGNDGDTIGPAVGGGPRDHDPIDQALADLLPEPVHVPDIVVVNDSCQLDLDGDHRAIALLEIRSAS